MPVEPGVQVSTQFAALTDRGLVRDHNEDNFLVMAESDVYLVADGMGGHNAGSLASEICVETVREFFNAQADDVDVEEECATRVAEPSLAEALIRSNRAILDKSHSAAEFSGMGTTAVGFRLIGNKVSIAHAGDSRAYLFREGMFEQLTSDHSLGNFLRQLGRESEAIMAEQTMSNVIMRALGLEPEIEIESSYLYVQPGDRLLLCSDGLSDMVGDEEIRRALLSRRFSRDELVQHLLDQALDAGGRDNITILLVDIVDEEASEESEEADSGGTLKLSPDVVEE
jgi:protein phosphatase